MSSRSRRAAHHAVEALGDRADLVVAHHRRTARRKSPRSTSRIAASSVAQGLGHAAGDEERRARPTRRCRPPPGTRRSPACWRRSRRRPAARRRGASRARLRASTPSTETGITLTSRKTTSRRVAHRQAGRAADLGQAALGKEGGQASAPLPLDGEEDERGRGRAGDDGDAEDRPERLGRLVDAGQQRPQDAPDQARESPAHRRGSGRWPTEAGWPGDGRRRPPGPAEAAPPSRDATTGCQARSPAPGGRRGTRRSTGSRRAPDAGRRRARPDRHSGSRRR